MTLKNLLLTMAVFIIANIGKAQSYQKTDYGVKAKINSIDIEIQFYGAVSVRVLKSPLGTSFKKESLSVIKKPQKIKLSIKDQKDVVSMKSNRIEVDLNLKTGMIAYSTITGEKLLTEKESGVKFTDFNDAGVKTFSVYQPFVLSNNEAIYGLGQHQNGKLSQRNLRYFNMIQGNTEDVIPFFQSNKGYGVYWDNYSPTTFIDNNEETSFNSNVGDCVDYYFMYGGNADGVIAQMRDLTGQVPMFPLWTFGYWQSKERYKSQNEIVGVVKKYRDLGVPIDGIIQDWQYWGNNYQWNSMEFLNPEYPDPKKMIDDVHKLNAHMIISIWASFGPKTKPYELLDKGGMLFNIKTWPESGLETWPPDLNHPSGVRVYDAYNPEARNIYWDQLNKGIFSLGMDGWWMDSTEPDHLQFKPTDLDTKTYLGSFRKVRNAFPLMTVGGVSDHQRSVTSDKRVFILTRSVFAGQQRYGANTWSGDTQASWDVLRRQITAGLNLSLCGNPYWNSDIGGFFLGKYPKKLNDPEYRELYVRWLQFGAFCPMMRSHGADAPREIYQFGNKGNKIYDAIEKSINLRYTLLPYIYSTSWDITVHNSSMMRALVMDFAKDKEALDITDQYMFGNSILVCPVTKQMYVNINDKESTKVEDFSIVKTKEVYLPKNVDWFDFWTGEKISGGQKVNKATPIDIIPLYVKAGSIIPFGPKVQYATEKKWDNLEIRVYPGTDGKFVLYEDENDNYNYEKGAFSTIEFQWNDKEKKLTICPRNGNFKGMLTERVFNIVIVDKTNGLGNQPSLKFNKSIRYKGKTLVVNS
jgi:alpha-D-xyloside xylohydrolase